MHRSTNRLNSASSVERFKLRTGLGLLAAASLVVLAACGGSDDPTESESSADETTLTITDAWVRSADEGMTAAFGELSNNSDRDIAIVSAQTSTATAVELHETVEDESGQMAMREIDGGFVIAAGDSRNLEPGGDHFMLMGITEPLTAGEEIDIRVTLDDESTVEFTASVRDFAGADENYEGGAH